MAVAGCVIIIVSGCFVGTNMTKAATFLSGKQMILYGLVVPLHGLHCLVVYAALFKGPTSKFGKLYQPYLPIIE